MALVRYSGPLIRQNGAVFLGTLFSVFFLLTMSGCTSCDEQRDGDAGVGGDGADGVDGAADWGDADGAGDRLDAGLDGADGSADGLWDGDGGPDGMDGGNLRDGDGGIEDGADQGPDVDCSMPRATTCGQLPADCCGDGTCSAAETCWNCPQDCGPCHELVWSLHLPESASPPALTADGHVVVNGEHRTFCIDSAGTILWDVPIGAYGPAGAPAIAADGHTTVVIGLDNTINWLDANGSLISQKRFSADFGHPTNSHACPALDGEKVAVTFKWLDLTTMKTIGRIALLYRSQSEGWHWDLGEHIVPAYRSTIDTAGNIIMINGYKRMVLDKLSSSGDLEWSKVLMEIGPREPVPEDWGAYCPTIGPDDSILIAQRNGKLLSLSSDGVVRWETDLGATLECEPAIGPDGTAYVGTVTGHLKAVSDSGEILWSSPVGVCQQDWPFPVAVAATPLVVRDGLLMTGCSDYIDVVRASDGARLYRIDVPGALSLTSSPVMTDGGLMFVVYRRWLHAFQTVHQGPETGLWTRAMGDCQNTSRAGSNP